MSSRKDTATAVLTWPRACKAFLGYLEGTQASPHTVSNYKLDLAVFEKHLLGKKLDKQWADLSEQQIEAFHEQLKRQKLKNNTRRRILLTLRRFYRFQRTRRKSQARAGDSFRFLRAPERQTKAPQWVPYEQLLAAIRQIPVSRAAEQEAQLLRARALLQVLAETGALVSEVAKLRFSQLEHLGEAGTRLEFLPPRKRAMKLSAELGVDLQALQNNQLYSSKLSSLRSDWVFLGFNKFGPLKTAISPRGVENIVKSLRKHPGLEKLTPRIIRHSTIRHWLMHGVSKKEVATRLGLSSEQALVPYQQIIKSSEAATSTA